MFQYNNLIKYFNLENSISFLFPFLVLFTYIGRGIYNSTLFLILCTVLYLIYKNKYQIIFRDKFFLFFLFFLFFVGITIPLADNIVLSFSKFGSFLFSSTSVVIAGLYLYIYSLNKRKNLIISLYILFFSSVCMEIITITSIYFDINMLVYIKTLGELKVRVSNGFHLIEIFTAAIIPLSLFLYYLRPSNVKLIFIIISIIGVLASTSRTALLATIIPLILFILIKNKGKIFNKEFVFTIFFIVIAFLIAFEISPQIQDRVKSFQTTFSSQGDRMSGRFTVYEESFNRFKTSILFGHGIKHSTENFIIIKHENFDEIVKHPHNIWLELLSDSGLLGFIPFLIFISFLLRHFYLKFKEISYIHKATIIGVLSSIFLSSLASWSIWSGNHIGPILVILLIIYSIDNIEIVDNN